MIDGLRARARQRNPVVAGEVGLRAQPLFSQQVAEPARVRHATPDPTRHAGRHGRRSSAPPGREGWQSHRVRSRGLPLFTATPLGSLADNSGRRCATLARMFPAFALAIALNVLQPAGTPPARPAPPPVSEATPVAVPPATPTALRYYTSGNRLWVLDQVLSIVLLAAILFSGAVRQTAHVGPADRAQLVLHDRCLLCAVHDRHLRHHAAAHLLRRVRAPARLRPLESDAAEMVDRLADHAGRHLRGRRAVPVGAVSAAAQEPAAMVAVHRRCRHSVHRRRQSRRADLDRAALQQVRADARQGARGAGSSRWRIARASKAAACSRSTRASIRKR